MSTPPPPAPIASTRAQPQSRRFGGGPEVTDNNYNPPANSDIRFYHRFVRLRERFEKMEDADRSAPLQPLEGFSLVEQWLSGRSYSAQ